MCTIWLYTLFTYLVTLVTLAIDLLPHLKPRDIFSFAKKLSHRTKFSLLFHRRESFLFGHSKIHFHTLMDGFHHTSIYFCRTHTHTHARIHEIFFNEELLFIQIDLHTLLLIQTQFEFVIVVEVAVAVVAKIVHVHLKFHYFPFLFKFCCFAIRFFCVLRFFNSPIQQMIHTISHENTYLHSQLGKINPNFFFWGYFRTHSQQNKKKTLKIWLNFWLGNSS